LHDSILHFRILPAGRELMKYYEKAGLIWRLIYPYFLYNMPYAPIRSQVIIWPCNRALLSLASNSPNYRRPQRQLGKTLKPSKAYRNALKRHFQTSALSVGPEEIPSWTPWESENHGGRHLAQVLIFSQKKFCFFIFFVELFEAFESWWKKWESPKASKWPFISQSRLYQNEIIPQATERTGKRQPWVWRTLWGENLALPLYAYSESEKETLNEKYKNGGEREFEKNLGLEIWEIWEIERDWRDYEIERLRLGLLH